MATAPASASSNDNDTLSIAILIGNPGGSGKQAFTANDGIPVAVWACQQRTRTSQDDPWKHTLTYYKFLDDSRWTHLDALLTRVAPVPILHVGSSENLSSTTNSKKSNNTASGGSGSATATKVSRMLRLLESLEDFLKSRSDLAPEETEHSTSIGGHPVDCQLHLSVSLDKSKLDASVSELLVTDGGDSIPDALLAYRGNVTLNNDALLQQGLALWLQGLVSTDDSLGSYCIHQGHLDSHLALDRTAAQCIHLLPPPNAGVATVVGGTPQTNSLLGILTKPCISKMGKHKMQLWLRQPLVDLEQIQLRQDSVTDLLGLGKDQIRDALKTFSGMDLGQLASSLGQYKQDDQEFAGDTKKPLQALYQLYLLASSKIPQLLEATDIHTDSELLQSTRVSLHQIANELQRSQDLVEAVLDMDQAPREYLVKPSFKEELEDLHAELQQVHQQVQDELEETQQMWAETSHEKSTIRLEETTEDGWQFRLPDTNDAKTLQNMSSKVYIHRVLKNGVYFSTQALRQLSTKHVDVLAEYQRHSMQVVRDAMKVAATYQTVVERACECVAMLDVLCAMAHVAAYSPHGYCKPILTDGTDDGMGIELKGARHPCVELQENVEYIPNDISLKFGESNFLLVTGPNMGGKSTYIRALGAIVTLAQIGMYVPCDSATINICHSILARVGAGDLQERGISTFMAEMLESSSILRTATKRSLIVIDELGRGTSTFDGYGLARAISEYLRDKVGCMVVFATHFHELTALEGIQNCHVSAQKGQHGLTFLYEVRPGPCLESFGIQVAEMANVPAPVIEDAKRKARQLENFDIQKRQRVGEKEKEATEHADVQFCRRFRNVDFEALSQLATIDERKAALERLLQSAE